VFINCPKCGIGKLNKVEIKYHEIADMPTQMGANVTTLEVDQCFVCKGIWFDAGELEKYIEKKLTILDSLPLGIDMIIELDKKIAKCPRCNIDMVKKPIPIAKDVTIDFCEKCRGIWLDNTEIDRIEAKNLSFKEKAGLVIKGLFRRPG
jgi:Zn-finger nucleic acid-binding protein